MATSMITTLDTSITSITPAAAKMKKTKSIKSSTSPVEGGDGSFPNGLSDDSLSLSQLKRLADETLETPFVTPEETPDVELVEGTEPATNSAATEMLVVQSETFNSEPGPAGNPAADETLNVSTATSETSRKSPPRRDPSKPSSNFTPIERTFILMAIAAVRADPKWRKSTEESPESVKDFTVSFCNAVRKKLVDDPDFRGKVAVASATPDREGKCKQSPSKESIRKIWTNLYVRGSITRDYTNMGRKKDFAAEERVKLYLQQNPECKMSSRAIAAQTNTSNRNVIRILRQENLAIRKTKFRRPDDSGRKTHKKTSQQRNGNNKP